MSKRSAKTAGMGARIRSSPVSLLSSPLVPQTQPTPAPLLARAPPSPSYSPASPPYVPSSPTPASAAALARDDDIDDDRIHSRAGSSVAVVSLATPPIEDETESIILAVVVVPNRPENHIVAIYQSRADTLALGAEWLTLALRHGGVLRLSAADEFDRDKNGPVAAFVRLSCAHPRIAIHDARQFLAHGDHSRWYPFALGLDPHARPAYVRAVITVYYSD